MKINEMIDLLKDDLRSEKKHLMFYLHSGTTICGLHRKEIGEFLIKEAASELKHCEEFMRMIIGLGGILTNDIKPYPINLINPKEILEYVYDMEMEVVHNYALRLKQSEELGGGQGMSLHVFYENQILDSYNTAIDVKEMLRNF
jgi:bacterioferritin (cytochrome b1)